MAQDSTRDASQAALSFAYAPPKGRRPPVRRTGKTKKTLTRHRRSGRKHPVRRPIRGKHESRLTYPGIALRKHPHTPPPRRELCMSPSTPRCECIINVFSSRTALPQRRLIHTPLTPRQEFKRGHSATTPPHFGGATRIPMPQRHRGQCPRRQRRVCAVTSS